MCNRPVCLFWDMNTHLARDWVTFEKNCTKEQGATVCDRLERKSLGHFKSPCALSLQGLQTGLGWLSLDGVAEKQITPLQ